MDYSSLHSIKKSGQRAFLIGIKRNDNPASRRTCANGVHLWDSGWLKQSKIKCKGIKLPDGEYSGCTQTDGDCPVCGL